MKTSSAVQWIKQNSKTFAQLFLMSVGVMNMTFLMIKSSLTVFDGFVFSLNLILVVGLLVPFKPIHKGLFVAWASGHCILIYVTKSPSMPITSAFTSKTFLDDLDVTTGMKNLIHVSIMASIWTVVVLGYSVAQLMIKTGNGNQTQTGNDSIVESVTCKDVCCQDAEHENVSSFPIKLFIKKIIQILKKFREEDKMIDIINA
jgi:hypothetical protein